VADAEVPPGNGAGRTARPGPEGALAATALARLRRLPAVLLEPSPVTMRRLGLAGVGTAAGIVATGAAVRLSRSGLGCTAWPKCTAASIAATGATGDPLVHRWIEFGNRLVTVAIFMVAIAVLVAAWRFRDQGRRRADLVWLAAAQPAGIVAQALLGGVVVLTKLNPVWVAAHFAVSAALVAAAVTLHVRCTESARPAVPLARPEIRALAWLLLAVVAVMLAAGTVVSGTGPLAGAPSVPRFPFRLAAVTQLHADIGWLLGGLAIALVLALRITDAPARAQRLSWLLLAAIGVQGTLGYAQYFTGLPAGLVWVHVTWALAVWIVMLRLLFALRDRGQVSGRPAAGSGTVSAGHGVTDPALRGDHAVR
jgi:heme a synthase